MKRLGLLGPMGTAERRTERCRLAYRSISKTTTEKNLNLVLGEAIVIGSDEDLITNPQVLRCNFSFWRKNRVIRRGSETPTALSAADNLALEAVVGSRTAGAASGAS